MILKGEMPLLPNFMSSSSYFFFHRAPARSNLVKSCEIQSILRDQIQLAISSHMVDHIHSESDNSFLSAELFCLGSVRRKHEFGYRVVAGAERRVLVQI